MADPDLSDFTEAHRRYVMRHGTPDDRALALPRQLELGLHFDNVFPAMSKLKQVFHSRIAETPHPRVVIPVLIEAIWLTWAFASEDIRTLRFDMDRLADDEQPALAPPDDQRDRIEALEKLVEEQSDAIAALNKQLSELRADT